MSCNPNPNGKQGGESLPVLPHSALDELLRRVACYRSTGTAILILSVNQGGVTDAYIDIKDRFTVRKEGTT